ncbi:MAG: DNA polymerase III subunit gamma/tau, partial [Kiloniellales bacterium]
NLAGELGELLRERTGQRWVVSLSQDSGDPTLREQARERAARMDEAAKQHPLVQAALETFPGARIVARRVSGKNEAATGDGENASKGDQGP